MSENVTLVCCGFSHSLVLVGENELYSFGYNTDFLGDSQFTGKLGHSFGKSPALASRVEVPSFCFFPLFPLFLTNSPIATPPKCRCHESCLWREPHRPLSERTRHSPLTSPLFWFQSPWPTRRKNLYERQKTSYLGARDGKKGGGGGSGWGSPYPCINE